MLLPDDLIIKKTAQEMIKLHKQKKGSIIAKTVPKKLFR